MIWADYIFFVTEKSLLTAEYNETIETLEQRCDLLLLEQNYPQTKINVKKKD